MSGTCNFEFQVFSTVFPSFWPLLLVDTHTHTLTHSRHWRPSPTSRLRRFALATQRPVSVARVGIICDEETTYFDDGFVLLLYRASAQHSSYAPIIYRPFPSRVPDARGMGQNYDLPRILGSWRLWRIWLRGTKRQLSATNRPSVTYQNLK